VRRGGPRVWEVRGNQRVSQQQGVTIAWASYSRATPWNDASPGARAVRRRYGRAHGSPQSSGVADLVKAATLGDGVAAIARIDALISVVYADKKTKTIRFANNLRTAIWLPASGRRRPTSWSSR
jgi:hypothetical protein